MKFSVVLVVFLATLLYEVDYASAGAAQSIPVIGEIVTAAECVGKGVAGVACHVVGEHKAGDELYEGVSRSGQNYIDTNAVVANIRIAEAAVRGDHEEIERLRRCQEHAWEEVGSSIPVVGHVVGCVHYGMGNIEKGDACMIGATRTALVGAAAAFTGGLGAAAAGVSFDGLATGIGSAIHQEYRPVGSIAGVTKAVQTGNASDIFDASAAPVTDYVCGKLQGKANAARTIINAEKITPAKFLPASRRVSVLERYTKFAEKPNSLPQVPYNKVSGSSLIKEFSSTTDLLKSIEPGTYDFVRLPDGKYRAINHASKSTLAEQLHENIPIGHSSLVEAGRPVIAAGEITVNPQGVISNINPLSGHFQVPLKVQKIQMGSALPASRLTFTAAIHQAFGTPAGKSLFRKKNMLKFTEGVSMLTPKDVDRLDSSKCFLAVREDKKSHIIGFTEEEDAMIIYDAIVAQHDQGVTAVVVNRENAIKVSNDSDASTLDQINELTLETASLNFQLNSDHQSEESSDN